MMPVAAMAAMASLTGAFGVLSSIASKPASLAI